MKIRGGKSRQFRRAYRCFAHGQLQKIEPLLQRPMHHRQMDEVKKNEQLYFKQQNDENSAGDPVLQAIECLRHGINVGISQIHFHRPRVEVMARNEQHVTCQASQHTRRHRPIVCFWQSSVPEEILASWILIQHWQANLVLMSFSPFS